jgi:GT2 family glycosyltransferase
MPENLVSNSLTLENPVISVVIVNYNGKEYIQKCLNSILASNYRSFEIIIVDNDSTDGSKSILKKYEGLPMVKVLYLSRNLHYAGGNVVGLHFAKGKYILFLNNDTIVDSNCLGEIVRTFEKDKKIWAVQPLLLNFNGKDINSIGGTIDYIGVLLPVFYLWTQNSVAREEKRLFWGSGAALCIRRDVLNKIGSFDPEVPTDEVDLCWRINLAGGKVVLAPKAMVYHYGSGAFGKGIKKERVFFAEISRLNYLLKNYDVKYILLSFPYMVSYFLMSVGWDIIHYRRGDILLYRLAGYFYVLKELRKILQKRLYNQSLRKISDSELRKLMIKPNPSYYLRPFRMSM